MTTGNIRLIDQARQTLTAAQNAIALKREAESKAKEAQREQEIAGQIQSTIANLNEVVLKAASEGKNRIPLFKLERDDYHGLTPPASFPYFRSKSLKEFCDFLTKEGFTVTAPDSATGGRDLVISINGKYETCIWRTQEEISKSIPKNKLAEFNYIAIQN